MKQEIVILGAGESGTGAAMLAASKGYCVFVSENGQISPDRKKRFDELGITWEEGGHTSERVLQAALIIKSPGIPFSVPVVREATNRGIEVIDELEFAYRFTSARIIAITGTNGKTTTTLLTYHILREAGIDAGLAGNVGKSLAAQLIEGDRDYWVVEISSFQLDGTRTFRPYIAVLLNITPDHLDRYDNSFEKYVDSKFRITRNQSPEEYFIVNTSQTPLDEERRNRIHAHLREVSMTNAGNAAWFEQGVLHFDDFSIKQADTVLRGNHNAVNMLCAVEVARLCDAGESDIRKALKSFTNVPHRMELVGTIADVQFFNDSKATNVDAVMYALGSFDGPLVWIAGGIDKGNNYDLITDEVKRKVKALICLGKDNRKLREAFDDHVPVIVETDDIRDAVRKSLDLAEKDGVVLLSPACASFDLFRNYEDRGDQFRKAVEELQDEDKTMTL